MAHTTAPALKAALFAALQALALDGVDVVYAMPSRKIGRDHIRLHRILQDEEAATLGAQRREERYDLYVAVRVVRAFAEDPQVTGERAFDIYSEVTDLIRSDLTVGGVVRTAEPVGWELNETANNESGWRDAQLDARIRCRARI
jgi:hypothetical protein